MTTRHFYSSADGLVLKSLRGAVSLNPSLRLHPSSRTIYTTHRSPNATISVICGGGSGHEPAYAGYTGYGMLDACVCGEVFASPSAKQVLTTIRLAAFGPAKDTEGRGRDVLVIMNNYTGDRLNFGLAIEKARVLFPQIRIESIVVADDVSLLDSNTTKAVGARGLAGNILICKLLGALAAAGGNDLGEMKKYGDAAVNNLLSIGVALEHCHVPGRHGGTTGIGEDECEVGLGLHNEPGVRRTTMRHGVTNVIKNMVDLLLRQKTAKDEEWVLFVNNLGGVSQLEMGALLADVISELEGRGISPTRVYCSSYMTSLNASGFSASLLNVSEINRTALDINTYDLLDAPTDAHSWLGVRRYWGSHSIEDTADYFPDGKTSAPKHTNLISLPPIAIALQSACQAVVTVENELTEYDTILGDGDCGHTFTSGALAVLAELQRPDSAILKLNPAGIAQHIAGILEDNMGGTIGALFGIYLNAYSYSLSPSPTTLSRIELYKNAPLIALHALANHTPAKPGDRTVIDALSPFCHSLALSQGVSSESLKEAVSQAIEGAVKTRGMLPKLGRAAYVISNDSGRVDSDTSANESGDWKNVMDPGAWGVAKLLEGFVDGWITSSGSG